MSQHKPNTTSRSRNAGRPRGSRGLIALEVAEALCSQVRRITFIRGNGHLRDQLWRAADQGALRLAEAGGHTRGLRRQHLEAAYAEAQEAQRALRIIHLAGMRVEPEVVALADRLGGLVFGLLKAER